MDEREPGDRLDEQEAIGRLADELLPALVAKLGTTGLGELEVRDGDWRVRLRRPLDGAAVIDVPHDRAGHRRPVHAAGRATARLMPVGPGLPGEAELVAADALREGPSADVAAPSRHRSIATSPAVGIFHGRPGIASGTRLTAGDPIGAIDVLGVSHEVVTPVDGILGQALVSAGEPVEYGQEIAWIEHPEGAGRGSRTGSLDRTTGLDGGGDA